MHLSVTLNSMFPSHLFPCIPSCNSPASQFENLWPSNIIWLNTTSFCMLRRRCQGAFWGKSPVEGRWIHLKCELDQLTTHISCHVDNVTSDIWWHKCRHNFKSIMLCSFPAEAMSFSRFIVTMPCNFFLKPWGCIEKVDLNVISRLQLNSFISPLERPTHFINVTTSPVCMCVWTWTCNCAEVAFGLYMLMCFDF